MTKKEAESKIQQLEDVKHEYYRLFQELNVQGRVVDEYYEFGSIINGNQIVLESSQGDCDGVYFVDLVEFEED